MIRRDWPRGAADPKRWLLISQPEHARLSGELAEAWGGPNVAPLVCPPDEADHPLAGVRRELIAAAYHHDDGWLGWSDAPRVDPESGKPLAFTEIPPTDAQRLWTDSIQACREHGLLAGWVVAAHFSALQSKRDGDYPEWVAWLADTDRRRDAWLAEWLAASPHHTRELAERCLAWLQTLDWISLWLCCRCPAMPGDGEIDPLEIGDDETGWPEIEFTPQPNRSDEATGVLRVEPWPFAEPTLDLRVEAQSIPVGRYGPTGSDPLSGFSRQGTPVSLAWRLEPA